ncbi:chitin synthase chs-2-like isoform X1 [Daphnia carinata]|uniref:chitin synthase chs-2-like isoform X1 n=2 Tax=Daphnia carinata TaxID=120202 RepID=UPI002868CC36|nr:chitin synthase chs-2-like isoform X1 [Daphnia carinata]
MASKDRAVYSKRLTPGRSSSSQDTSTSDYGRVIHSNFHFAEGPSALYSGRRSALEDASPINKPLVSLDVNIDSKNSVSSRGKRVRSVNTMAPQQPMNVANDPGVSDEEEYTEDEESPLTNNDIYGGSQRSAIDTKGWDVFRNLPPEDLSGSLANQKVVEMTVKIFKVVAYLLTFVVVLSAGVISKGTVLFMTSQIKPGRSTEYCTRRAGRSFQAHLSEDERVSWMWALLFSFVIPEFFMWFRSSRICFFRQWKRPRFFDFMVVVVFETLHVIGVAMLIYAVLPNMKVVQGAMLTNCVCLVPGILGLLSRNSKESKRFAKSIVDIFAIMAQISGCFLWVIPELNKTNWHHVWMLPASLILTSFGWWENYVDKHSPIGFVKYLGKIKEKMKATRYFTYIFVSVWKVMVFFCSMLLIELLTVGKMDNIFLFFMPGFGDHKVNLTELSTNKFANLDIPGAGRLTETETIPAWPNTAIYLCVIQSFASMLCFGLGKFACKICIQGFSYAFPVNLTIPVTISLLIAFCGLRIGNPCMFSDAIPPYLYWDCPNGDFLTEVITNQYAWVWLLWLLSQTWITLHIWTPKCERLATTEKLFVNPFYCSLLIDQSMGMNRRRDDESDVKTEDIELERDGVADTDMTQYYETISIGTESSTATPKTVKASDSITRIYTCATMWHETTEEMLTFLKSIFHMDEDQSARRVAQKYLKIVDPDYYEYETHIFFDDAFELSDHSDDDVVANRFVKLLMNVMDEAASHVHQTNIRLRPPKKYPTPYGGRLVWTLPGKTKMIAHLKDKGKIRHRKRWSQVMYMYYLLGHKLMELPISVDRKEVVAENTFLLTLDGDIDFLPNAVQLLVDLMKKNRNLGAACGRIHPVGSGPMVWYQLFEYAIGHWLQKATEHMIGCVLCSPGCFSLFRGKALMDDNVMRKYTTRSDEARHYVQYDQGEDRWLCTLLLQRGYRVEYSAASDAYTHCPEGFNEFYNQRRRWVPSTMANIMDLLGDYKRTIKINDNISLPYIFYQSMLMGGTILGPGTIFLMLVGAFVAAFRIDNWSSFIYNLIPILFFMFICFVAKSEIQLLVAQILSACYALIMMAVIVGTALQLGEDGIGSPSAIFLIALSGSFFIAACLHPQEFWCVVPGLLYLMMIPSMYLLLILYSIINLNVVSWGTREVQTKKSKKEIEREKKEAEEEAKKAKMQKKSGLLGFFNSSMTDSEEGSLELSFAGLFKIMCCTHQKAVDEKQQLLRIADTLESLNKRLDIIERAVDPHGLVGPRRRSMSRTSHRGGGGVDGLASVHENDGGSNTDDSDDESDSVEPKTERDELINPYWIEDKDLKRGEVDYLSGPEIQFWKDLLDKYLYPIDENKEQQARIAADLIELRNKSVFFFFMFNALFILIVFLLQLNKGALHVDWPLGVKTNITYIEETSEVLITKEYLQLEPIGLVFVFFFGLILIIQFVAMLFHRFGTLSHILASTELSCCSRKVDDLSEDAFIDKNAVEIVRNLQRLRGIDDADEDNESGSYRDRIGHRRTIHNLEKQKQKKRITGTLDVAFKKRFFSMTAEGEIEDTPVMSNMRKIPMRRETIKALEVRRNTVMGEARKRSTMQTLGANNEFNRNKNRHRNKATVVGNTVERIYSLNAQLNQVVGNSNAAVPNEGYEMSSDEDRSNVTRNSMRHAQPTPQPVLAEVRNSQL